MPQKPVVPPSATLRLSRICLASLRVSTRGRSGSLLAGLASFCLAGAVVLGVVERVPQHAAELAFEDACALTPRSPSKEAEFAIFRETVAAAAGTVTPPAAPLGHRPEVPEKTEHLAQAFPSDSAGPQPAAVGAVDPPVRTLEKSLAAQSAFIPAPLPPSRPRALAPRARLASMRQPIEFRLADRGNTL